MLDQTIADTPLCFTGIEINDAQNFFEDVARVGPSAHFLMEEATAKACHSTQFYDPQLVERSTYEEWLRLGLPNMSGRARKRVQAIIESPLKNALPADIVGKLEEIMQRADNELG